ncbi:N-acetylglucosamine kinase [Oceaniglobus trochenteri]|uniref:N-acetylglucosamine kinase n=1 Tax=Oceaniglobus trochenteri TaxID=2763260 RepID=UPI001D000DF5|nr:BadF/BadG/BcrA/BcrD ATPase family protein [Oceaniglobus trochenteri]
MMAGGHVLGVDGGASKTIALVARADDGTVVGAGRSDNADIYQTPDAERHVATAIVRALSDAGITGGQIEAAALSLIGADWPEDIDHWLNRRADLGLAHLPDDRWRVVNDGIGGLEALDEDGAAVAVVCGTGAAVSARGTDGAYWHSSFWQRTQGSLEMAEAALDAVYLADLGIGAATALTEAAVTHFDCPDVEGLLHLFTARKRRNTRNVGTFTPLLIACADAGDAVARRIVLDHAEALAGYAVAAARKVSLPADAPVALIMNGGVFQADSSLMTDRIWQIFSARFPGARRIEKRTVPVVGAVAMALRLTGDRTGAPCHQRILETLPDAEFFRTDKARTPETSHED